MSEEVTRLDLAPFYTLWLDADGRPTQSVVAQM